MELGAEHKARSSIENELGDAKKRLASLDNSLRRCFACVNGIQSQVSNSTEEVALRVLSTLEAGRSRGTQFITATGKRARNESAGQLMGMDDEVPWAL